MIGNRVNVALTVVVRVKCLDMDIYIMTQTGYILSLKICSLGNITYLSKILNI